MRHFAASVEDLNRWPSHPNVVVILENKETGYAVTDDLPGTVILHGHGRYVEQYARIAWVLTAQRVVYWGDLDVFGLQFISDLRCCGVPAVSILTDCATLQRYQRLAVSTKSPLPHPSSPNGSHSCTSSLSITCALPVRGCYSSRSASPGLLLHLFCNRPSLGTMASKATRSSNRGPSTQQRQRFKRPIRRTTQGWVTPVIENSAYWRGRFVTVGARQGPR
jgi:hypothetical protein